MRKTDKYEVKTHSPCEHCINNSCNTCKYHIIAKVFTEVLKKTDSCKLCVNAKDIIGGFTECTLGYDNCCDCNTYAVDIAAVAKEYEINL